MKLPETFPSLRRSPSFVATPCALGMLAATFTGCAFKGAEQTASSRSPIESLSPDASEDASEDASGGDASADAGLPLPRGDVYAVNAGGGAVGGYTADQDFISSGGGVFSTTQPIHFSEAAGAPAPAAVYSDARQEDHFSYVFPGLLPNHGYAVIFHFAELYWSMPGQRQFDVTINGKAVLTNFDIVATCGSPFGAVDEFFFPYSDANGTIEVDFSRGAVDQPSLNGIEIRGDDN